MWVSQALAHKQDAEKVHQYFSRTTSKLYFRVSHLSRQSCAAILLCVAAAFGLFVFVDDLLEFIEFAWSDVLKRDPECVLSDPLHARVRWNGVYHGNL